MHKKSIAHFEGREQQILFKIKNALTGKLQPLIIYLLDCRIQTTRHRSCFRYPQRMETWQLSCDLLVILPEGQDPPDTIAEELKCLSADIQDITILHHSLGFMKKQLGERSLFFNWIRRCAIVLYARDGVLNELPPRISKNSVHQQQAMQYYSDHPDYAHRNDIKLERVEPLTEKNALPGQFVPVQFAVKEGQLFLLPVRGEGS